MQTATVVLGLAAWWSSVCRVGQMHPRTHRVPVMLWHLAIGALALGSVAQAVLAPDPIALGVVTGLAGYAMATLPAWQYGPPAWATKGGA